jgi:glycosyltransferase involved in cell wall biosynthesis
MLQGAVSLSMNDQPHHTGTKKPLRIAVLAHPMRVAGGRSVGLNLLAALGRRAPQHSYFITIPAECGYEEALQHIPGAQLLVCPQSMSRLGRLIFETFTVPTAVRAFEPDVVFGVANRGLLRPPCPQAILCQDAHQFYPIRRYHGETVANMLVQIYHRIILGRQLRHTQLLFGQTPVAEARLRQTFGFQGRTAICPNAVSAFTMAGVSKPYVPGPLKPYASSMKLFCLSRFYPHKNIESFITLFQRYGRELEGVVVVTTVSHTKFMRHPRAAAFLKAIESHQGQIVNVGRLRQSQLAPYFRACQGLLMPTLLESFSGTYLEAMHFGLPILTSDLDFAQAICGPAALYFDPRSPAAMKDAILKLKNDPALGRELINAGQQQLQTHFKSWDEIAADVEKALADLVAR